MSKPRRRAILIGIDGASMDLVLLMVKEGHMPNLEGLIERGAHAPMLGVLPTLTPPGWTAMVTGAWPGTHGITEFCMYRPGLSFNDWEQGIDTGQCRAEYLWNTCERAGGKPILVKWEMSWPPTVTTGLQVEGVGPGLANYAQVSGYHHFVVGSWIDRSIGGTGDPQNVDPSRMEGATRIDPVTVEDLPEGFSNVPESRLPVKLVRIDLKPLHRTYTHMRRGEQGDPKPLNVVVYATGGDGYDRVRIVEGADASETLGDLAVGDWSEWRKELFRIDGEDTDGYLRFKLIALNHDLSSMELFAPQVWGTDKYTQPDELGAEIDENVGNFLQNPSRDAMGAIDDDTYFELLEAHHESLHKTAAYLCRDKCPDWDMLFIETHASDFANHGFLGMADPISGAEPDVLARCRKGLERTYRSIDRWIGEVLKLADENTVVVVASDHGGTPNQYGMPKIDRILEDAGLSVYAKNEKGKRVCDFGRSRAVLHPHNLVNIFVNMKGRDPDGIVDPAEYYQTQLEIIDALYAYRDPDSGHCPFSVVLTKDDARLVNLWGERVGDVVYALRPEYDGAHGRQLPTARLGIGSQRSTFVIAGPGVRDGLALERSVRVVDVAPTVCHLTGLPMPQRVEGSILYEALEG